MAVSAGYDVRLRDVLAEHARGARQAPGPREVVVALARPEQMGGPAAESGLLSLLSEDERARLSRFRSPQDGRLFLLAHALLRVALSVCSGDEPRGWQFRLGEHGRPEIAAPRSRFRFSLSHTRGLAACAIVLDRDIGLDVEYSAGSAPGLAPDFFSSVEAEELRNTPETARADRFFMYWTLKEAFLKAKGVGLSLPLRQFSMYDDAEGAWRIAFHEPLGDDPERWWFWTSPVGRDHRAALALRLEG